MPLIINDIKWRNLDNCEDCGLLDKFPIARLLIETDIDFCIELACYVDQYNGYLTTHNERIKRFAFIDSYNLKKL